MSDKLNYKSGLLYLYWLMSGADGVKKFDQDDPEWRAMKLMREHEDISDDDFNDFINTDFGSQDKQLKNVLEVFKTVPHEQKVKALAWMDFIMIADGKIHSKEYELYTTVRKEFGIEEDEIKFAKIDISNLNK